MSDFIMRARKSEVVVDCVDAKENQREKKSNKNKHFEFHFVNEVGREFLCQLSGYAKQNQRKHAKIPIKTGKK